ncbi:MAG: hypothetical protein ACQ9MH_09325 [Nitrospinales bacterium]
MFQKIYPFKYVLLGLAIFSFINFHTFISTGHADDQEDEMEQIMEGIMDDVLDEEDNKVKEQIKAEDREVLTEDIIVAPSEPGERVITLNIDNIGVGVDATATFDFGAGSSVRPPGTSAMVNLLPEFFPPGNFTLMISCAGGTKCEVSLAFTAGGSCPAINDVDITVPGSMNFSCTYF